MNFFVFLKVLIYHILIITFHELFILLVHFIEILLFTFALFIIISFAFFVFIQVAQTILHDGSLMEVLVICCYLILNFLSRKSSILICISSIYQEVIFPTYNVLCVEAQTFLIFLARLISLIT